MSYKNTLLSVFLLVAEALGAAIVQRPLKEYSLDQRVLISDDLTKLREAVGSLLFEPKPIAAPCYSKPGHIDPSQCVFVHGNKTNDVWISDQAAGYFNANWASCEAEGQGCPISLGSNGSIPPSETCFQGSVPDLMIKVQSVGDIQAAFKYATKNKTPLVIKNTGHDGKGRSAGRGTLALWTHGLNSSMSLERNFIPQGCSSQLPETVFHIPPGQNWEGAYEFAHNKSLSILGGTCGTVGIAGWLHGGGHSPLTPVYGMGADNLRQVEIVTPRGERKIANQCLNSDLFFAVRGGGGGTFGVVTNITYKALPIFKIQEFYLDLPDLTKDDLHELLDIITNMAIPWSQKGWGGYIKPASKGFIRIVNPNSTLEMAKKDMQPLVSFLHARSVTYTPISNNSWYDYYLTHLKDPGKHLSGSASSLSSRLLPPDVFNGAKRHQLIDNIAQLALNSAAANGNLSPLLMLVTPTAFPHTNTSALHPSWSSAIWSIRVTNSWDQYEEDHKQPDKDYYRQYFRDVHRAMEPFRKLAPNMGVSISEADIWEDDHERAFWGEENYKRLLGIKAQVDPHNVLSNYMAVGWEKGAERYRCYPKKDVMA